MKKLLGIYDFISRHWVGDGFPVRTLFSYDSVPAPGISPFLMLDYAGPANFPPAERPRGVGEHPHRGFETVTIMYQGAVEHRDSGGGGGRIGPGDVQWMTAASGVVHEELHSKEFTRTGGAFEAAQLWVNLPSKLKMSPPRYQEILDGQIPSVALPNDGGAIRVISGNYEEAKGPANTYTPVNLWDVKVKAGHSVALKFPEGYTTAIAMFRGALEFNGSGPLTEAKLALFERKGTDLEIRAKSDAAFLILNGEPIDEPLVGYGPFVMNTQQEIHQAISDYQSGRMGHLS